MLEFMDAVAINAVEDKLKMGLDRDAAALLLAGSDERGRSAAEDAQRIAGVFEETGATDVFSTDDPDEGEAFVAARRFAIPAVEAKGTLLLEDVGVPLPRIGDLVSGVARIATERDVMISVVAHAGDGNTHPLIVYDPRRRGDGRTGRARVRRDHESRDRSRWHDYGRARRRPAEKALVGGPGRPGSDGAEPAHQAGARPR